MDEETVVYLCGRQREHVVWYQFVLESSTVLSKGEKRDREGHTIEGTTSSPIALIHADKFGRGGCWAVIGGDIYYAGGRSREDREVTTDKDLIKHNIHHNDSSSWETVTSLTIPRTGSFLAPVGRKLAIVSGMTMPLHPRPTPEVRRDNWRNCGEIYDLDTQSLDYLTSPMHYFDPYQSFPFSNSTTVLEDPKQVVFYNLEKGTLLILDASNGVIIENKTTPDPCFALWADSFMEDPPQGLRGCEDSIALLRIAVSNSRAVFHRRTFYQFTYGLMLYGYDVDQRKWFRSECLQHILKLPVHKITFPPLLIGLPNENLLVILFSKKVKPIMASLSVEKKLGSTTLDVNVKHIQHFHPQPFFFPCYGGIAIVGKKEDETIRI